MWCGAVVLLAASAVLVAAGERDARFAEAVAAAARRSKIIGEEARRGGVGGAALVFSEGLRQLLERHLLGMCEPPSPPAFKIVDNGRRGVAGNWTVGVGADACASEDPRELAAKLAELSLRASMLSRSQACDNQLALSLAHTLGDLARNASRAWRASTNKGAGNASATAAESASSASEKKRKLSKSQKNKLQAKQKTALAVKKKAAAAAAAALSKLRTELPV